MVPTWDLPPCASLPEKSRASPAFTSAGMVFCGWLRSLKSGPLVAGPRDRDRLRGRRSRTAPSGGWSPRGAGTARRANPCSRSARTASVQTYPPRWRSLTTSPDGEGDHPKHVARRIQQLVVDGSVDRTASTGRSRRPRGRLIDLHGGHFIAGQARIAFTASQMVWRRTRSSISPPPSRPRARTPTGQTGAHRVARWRRPCGPV
jgi:hypothetical protein